MSFLEPLLLLGLPLAALPIIIHLINQRRFQNVDWGAMRFLLEANRMSRGYARIRQWVILFVRTLAIAALIVMIARPLARGRLGLMGGGRADTTLILLDRSASMSQRGPGAVDSKLETGVEQLSQALETLGSSRWVLIDSVTLKPQELESPHALLESAAVAGTSASSDLPALIQAAHDYIRANRTGQTEIWICSDLRANDWNAASSQWAVLRDAFHELPQGVRFHLLAYPELGEGNVSVRVAEIRRQVTSDGASLLTSLAIHRSGGADKMKIPLQIELDGARSELVVEAEGSDFVLQDHPIPIEANKSEGWGRISIPADVNPADNEFYFSFSEPTKRRTIIVAEDEAPLKPLQLAAAISPDSPTTSAAEVVAPANAATITWDDVALLIWQAPLPENSDARAINSFVERGGQVIFLPPENPGDAEFDGVAWGEWKQPDEPLAVDSWRSDQDVLERTQSGEALPVGELSIRRYCMLKGDMTPLATLYGGDALLARAASSAGGAYFLATTATTGDSSLAANGVVLYAFVQRALQTGAAGLSKAQQLAAGAPGGGATPWQQLAGLPGALSTEYSYHAGVYAAGERILAVNRSVAEDRDEVLADDRVDELFQGLDFDRVDDRGGNVNSLAREVWRVFLLAMIAALLVESALCMPKRPQAAGALA